MWSSLQENHGEANITTPSLLDTGDTSGHVAVPRQHLWSPGVLQYWLAGGTLAAHLCISLLCSTLKQDLVCLPVYTSVVSPNSKLRRWSEGEPFCRSIIWNVTPNVLGQAWRVTLIKLLAKWTCFNWWKHCQRFLKWCRNCECQKEEREFIPV